MDFQACHGSNFFDTFSVQSKLTEWKDTHTIRVYQISQSDQASDACDRGLDFTFLPRKNKVLNFQVRREQARSLGERQVARLVREWQGSENLVMALGFGCTSYIHPNPPTPPTPPILNAR